MCGIVGLLDPTRATSAGDLEATASQMAERLRHRGPDDGGTWSDADAGTALGFRRLAVLDPTPDGAQPMVSADGRWVLVYNGEIYNFRELRRRLDPVRWRSDTDTEVVLEGIARWGIATMLREANGMFALAAWDRHREELTLARDRVGIKPLYFGHVGRDLVFASETGALRAHPRFRLDLDRDVLRSYLRMNYVPADRSILRGVRQLAPGTHVTLSARSGIGDPAPYWSFGDVAAAGVGATRHRSPEEAVDELDELLSDAVRSRMVADVPLGAFLSGGIDSSTVVALMQQVSDRPVRTFTVGFAEADHDEAPHARAVARHLGTDHTEMYVSPSDAGAVVPQLPEIYDEPFADSSQIPTFLISQLARRDVTVALSGDGGDELFGGYGRYREYRDLARALGRVPAPARPAAAGLLRSLATLPTGRPGTAHAPWAPWRRRLGKLAVALDGVGADAAYQQLLSRWSDPGLVVVGGDEVTTAFDDPAVLAGLGTPAEHAMLLDSLTYLPGDILTKVDRASMAVSLEVRVPMLDHRVVEHAWRLPVAQRLAGGEGKRMLRLLLARYVPPELTDRPKMGFGIPMDRWLRGPLRPWVDELLAPSRLAADGVLVPAVVRDVWHRHLAGEDHTERLWGLVCFQAWWDHARAGTPGRTVATGGPVPVRQGSAPPTSSVEGASG